mmetsp:Transcript_12479/g.18625  ORF Transcript_12479/g.18625 Transcript_12479/m.18625 type:complete len:394 (-) Transcript_12479:79-1260(-)
MSFARQSYKVALKGSQRRGIRCFSQLPPTFVEGFHDPETVKKMRYRTLGNRCLDKSGKPMEVSIVSLGGSPFGGLYDKNENLEEGPIKIVHEAVKAGVNLIDTAAWYGHGRSEEIIGKALKDIPREAYYINTKVCRYKPEVTEMFNWDYKRTKEAIDVALEKLNVDYIDTIQVHDPEFAPALDLVMENVFPAFLEAKKEGKVRMLGVTGYPLSILREQIERAEAMGVEINTCLSYCHYNLHDTTLKTELIPFLKEKGIGLIGASPISMGLLSEQGPPSWHPASEKLKELAAQAAEYCKEEGVDIGRLCMQFALEEESIPTTLVGTTSIERWGENLKHVYDLGNLSKKEREVLQYLVEDLFGSHGTLSWEGVEIANYWQLIDKARKGDKNISFI